MNGHIFTYHSIFFSGIIRSKLANFICPPFNHLSTIDFQIKRGKDKKIKLTKNECTELGPLYHTYIKAMESEESINDILIYIKLFHGVTALVANMICVTDLHLREHSLVDKSIKLSWVHRGSIHL